MKKLVLAFLLAILASNLVLSANLNVEVSEKKDVVLVELENPASFKLSITNNESITDKFEIFSLVGVSIFPKEAFQIESGETKELEIQVVPHKETIRDISGFYAFEYNLKGKQTGFFTDRLTIKIVKLKDAIEVKPQNILPDDNYVILTLTNLEELELDNVTVTADSFFFEFSDTLDFAPNEKKEFTIPIKKEEIKKLSAGEYDVAIDMEIKNKKSEYSVTLKYLERGGISTSTEASGLIVREKTTTKTNEGNVNAVATIEERKDVLSRLFTTHSEAPLTSERKGLFVDYTWEKELAPGENFSITSKTNYTFPFVLLIIVIILVLLIKFMLIKPLVLEKRVSYIKTKGGEFALKVRLRVKTRKSLQNIKIVDRIPRLTKLYESFGMKPHKIDENTRTISWHFDRLNLGEERVFTYVIYSKVNIVGRFELPYASASYEQNGKIKEVFSNKAYFAREDIERREEE